MKTPYQSIDMIPTNKLIGKQALEEPYKPFVWYKEMREKEPICFNHQADMWNVFLYEDVKTVLEDKEYFSNIMPEKKKSPFPQSILGMDPPKHTQMRSIVNRSFTPKALREWEPRIQQITNDILNQLSNHKTFDIVRELFYPLPVIVIAEMLGVSAKDMERFKKWSDIIVSSPSHEDPDYLKEFFHTRLQAENELGNFFEEIIQLNRGKAKKDSNDIISLLVQSEADINISSKELVAFCKLLLVAGNETTTNLLGNALYCLIEHPNVYEQLQQDLSLIPKTIEEVLRYRSPVQRVVRRVKKEIQLKGQTLQVDQIVSAWVGSANRDSYQFKDADSFNIYRRRNPHLTFGHGIHFCLGAPLARLEAKIVLTELIKRYKSFSFIDQNLPTPISNSSTIYGLSSFPVKSELLHIK
ncbi:MULTISPECIES: cytochrome P450 [Bacillus cereus group]|uniref:Cytochrome P450 n=1 Tax=Bacillus cytotoxicus (strain DSM 22905 / CIP 110041 / 391-98 / NVH 391-98) TaxID=315749 RepID=A7GUQ2_BACCN|nr:MULTISPECIES: cytochrome P450 [Bacillus cereus group]ABS23860.1 cytochrome P450 [Bacillus cytotoxicus NVH 391-98]AWC46463.1 cytochrome P450 [Bacillus cytotoxicus]MDH2865187.1 cytochrome P450 [Bacillus cytotoxicus]MDH2884980.1 cytochrome P450 [Bacillus cytotoxicus]MDH2888562.1 cytochrome P450 [Bacillus cytotoxicus]